MSYAPAPHHTQITAQDQAQIYQELVTSPAPVNSPKCGRRATPGGRLTTSFLSICGHVKENRAVAVASPLRGRLAAVSREALLEPRAGNAITLEEWVALDEDEPGEVVDGRIEEEEVPDYVHEVLVSLLTRLLANWVVPRGGLVGGSGGKFAVAERRGRKPDLTVYLPGSALPPRRGLIRVPPDVAVEVVSPTPRDARRDRVEKVDEYAAFGVRWYWLVDPELRSLEILELGDDGRYVHALGASSGAIDPVPGCEGLALDLDELWAAVDRLPVDEPA